MTDNCGDNINFKRGEWDFDNGVAKSFDEHVIKSIPGYSESHQIISILCDHFLLNNDALLDIGCSTGSLIKTIADRHDKPGINFVGIDSSREMIKIAKQKNSKNNQISFINNSFLNMEFENKFDVITLVYTAQFIRTKDRQKFINKIFNLLNWGGALFMFEKTRGADARFNEIINNSYIEWKILNGFTLEEVLTKQRSLQGRMESFSVKGNVELLKRSGFKDIESVWKWGPFEGFLAIK